jgi:hypothetical protein
MNYSPLKLIVLGFAPLLLRTLLYFLACKIRSIHITLLSCIILAGSGLLISIIPIPLPMLLSKALAICLAMFLMTRYTEAELYPDVVLIPFLVEILSSALTEFMLSLLGA